MKPENTLSRRQFIARGAGLAGTLATLGACARLGDPPAPASAGDGAAAFYADGLSFLPEDPADVARSGLDAFLCDVSLGEMDTDANGNAFYHRTFELCDRSIREAAERIGQEFPGLRVALDGSDVGVPGTRAAVFQFQGCEPIGTDLSRIEYFRDRSLRVLQLTHNESNGFATSYVDERSGQGLSPLGIEGVREMNRLRLIPDVSHASERTALDTVEVSNAPVILSHTACRALLPHPRAATDAMIRAVAESGGIVGIFMMSFWLTDAPVPTVEHYVRQIRHAVDVAGIDAVGIANDYAMGGQQGSDGPFDNERDMGGYLKWWEGNRARGIPGFETTPRHAVIPELNNIDRMPLIHRALLDHGFASADAEKIAGLNWKRFLVSNLR